MITKCITNADRRLVIEVRTCLITIAISTVNKATKSTSDTLSGRTAPSEFSEAVVMCGNSNAEFGLEESSAQSPLTICSLSQMQTQIRLSQKSLREIFLPTSKLVANEWALVAALEMLVTRASVKQAILWAPPKPMPAEPLKVIPAAAPIRQNWLSFLAFFSGKAGDLSLA